jgi:hypothetical protein
LDKDFNNLMVVLEDEPISTVLNLSNLNPCDFDFCQMRKLRLRYRILNMGRFNVFARLHVLYRHEAELARLKAAQAAMDEAPPMATVEKSLSEGLGGGALLLESVAVPSKISEILLTLGPNKEETGKVGGATQQYFERNGNFTTPVPLLVAPVVLVPGFGDGTIMPTPAPNWSNITQQLEAWFYLPFAISK